MDEPGGGAGGAPGRRAGGAGRHVRQWPGGAGRALLPARPLARATTILRARRRAGTLNTRADKSFIFQSLTSLTRSPSCGAVTRRLGKGTPSWEGGGMRGDSRHPRVDPSKGCECRPGHLQVHARPCRPHAPVPRPQRSARDVGVLEKSPGTRSGTSGERVHLSRRVRAKLGAEERAGFESAGGGLRGARGRRGSINSRPGLTGAAVTGGVASPAARGEGGARGAAGWGRRTPVSWWRRQEAEGEESRRVRRAGAGRCFPAPGCVASVASAVGGGGLWGGARGGGGGGAQHGFVWSCGAERLARWPGEAPFGFPQDARPTAGVCGGSTGLWP